MAQLRAGGKDDAGIFARWISVPEEIVYYQRTQAVGINQVRPVGEKDGRQAVPESFTEKRIGQELGGHAGSPSYDFRVIHQGNGFFLDGINPGVNESRDRFDIPYAAQPVAAFAKKVIHFHEAEVQLKTGAKPGE